MNEVIACSGLGTSETFEDDVCCFLHDQNSTACRNHFAPETGLLDRGCAGRGAACNLFDDCRDVAHLFSSIEQNEQGGNGSWLIALYNACANLPAIASLSRQGLLVPYIEDAVRQHIRPDVNETAEIDFRNHLRQLTSTVTDCLSSTCRHSRDMDRCYDVSCSPVNVTGNSTSPNITGINGCLNTLCQSGTRALPWADADVVGIGVFSSYVMQCALVIILWAGLVVFTGYRVAKGQPDRPSTSTSRLGGHFGSWIDLLLEFHKAQCYFGATLMIATTVSNIFDVDIVVTFLLTLLTTNSILPIISTYLLLVYYRVSSAAIALLTALVYALSSVVYWVNESLDDLLANKARRRDGGVLAQGDVEKKTGDEGKPVHRSRSNHHNPSYQTTCSTLG